MAKTWICKVAISLIPGYNISDNKEKRCGTIDKTLEILKELREQLAYEFVKEYGAGEKEAHRLGNVLLRAIEAILQRYPEE